MTRARDLAVVAVPLAWWSPALLVMALGAAPHFVAVRGRRFRIRRAHRLMDRGQIDEAERVVAALRRERGVMERWNGKARP